MRRQPTFHIGNIVSALMIVGHNLGVTGLEPNSLGIVGSVPVILVKRVHLQVGKAIIEKKYTALLTLQRIAKCIGHALPQITQPPFRSYLDRLMTENTVSHKWHQHRGRAVESLAGTADTGSRNWLSAYHVLRPPSIIRLEPFM